MGFGLEGRPRHCRGQYEYWGGKYPDQATCDNDNLARKAAIDNLRSVGIATVIASGNEGFDQRHQFPRLHFLGDQRGLYLGAGGRALF